MARDLEKNCEFCGRTYSLRFPYQLAKSRFCSHHCRNLWNTDNLAKVRPRRPKRVFASKEEEKEYRRNYHRQWLAKHPKYAGTEYQRQWKKAHPGKEREYHRNYRRAHRDREREKQRRQVNTPAGIARRRRYYERTKELQKARSKVNNARSRARLSDGYMRSNLIQDMPDQIRETLRLTIPDSLLELGRLRTKIHRQLRRL